MVGRMEKKELERARQEKLETTIAVEQAAQLKIMLPRLLSTDLKSPHLFFSWPLPRAENHVTMENFGNFG